jgi:hypothetical protein
MAFFKKKQPSQDVTSAPPPPQVSLDLAVLQEHAAQSAALLAGAEVNLDLVRARLGDACRDAGVRPVPPAQLEPMLASLDEEARRRFALGVAVLQHVEIASRAPAIFARFGGGSVATQLLVLVGATGPLTMGLLRESPLRAQEFTRHLIRHLLALVKGERPEESVRQLQRLDYGRLLEEAERAKMSASERLEYLRKLQEERAPRRGKW